MKSFEKDIYDMIDDIASSSTIEIADIPKIDLYMDQLTTFMNDNLKDYKRNASDKILTKTMINNYAKARLFPPPARKKYTRNHIMLLIIIYHMKSVLSISDVKRLLTPIIIEIKESGKSEVLENIYNEFVRLRKRHAQIFANELKGVEMPPEVIKSEFFKEQPERVAVIISVLMLAIDADNRKRLAEKILDKFF